MLTELSKKLKRVGSKLNLNPTKIISADLQNALTGKVRVENVTNYIYLEHEVKLGKENRVAEVTQKKKKLAESN